MFNIQDYLLKFKNLGQEESRFKDVVVESVLDFVGVEIQKKDVLFKNGFVSFAVSPGIKSAIFIKKEKITNKIKSVTGKDLEIR